MRKNRVVEQNRCYHLVSRLAHRAFFLDDEEKDRAVALMRRVETGAQAGMSYSINNTLSMGSDPFAPSQLRPGHVWSGLADDGFLMKIGAAARGRDGDVHPTLAGLVCFGDFNEITNVLPYFFLDYREHLSPDVRWTDRVCSGDANWSGNIFDFFFRINQSITAGVKVPFKIASDNVTRDDDMPVDREFIHGNLPENNSPEERFLCAIFGQR